MGGSTHTFLCTLGFHKRSYCYVFQFLNVIRMLWFWSDNKTGVHSTHWQDGLWLSLPCNAYYWMFFCTPKFLCVSKSEKAPLLAKSHGCCWSSWQRCFQIHSFEINVSGLGVTVRGPATDVLTNNQLVEKGFLGKSKCHCLVRW